MSSFELFQWPKGSLRRKIFTYVAPMVLLSVLSSTISLYRMTEVNELLESINHVTVPLGRLFAQLQSDVEVLQRELERNLGYANWKDPHWKPRPVPHWIESVLQNELTQIQDLINLSSDGSTAQSRAEWQEWLRHVNERLKILLDHSSRLYQALEHKDQLAATEIYSKWAGGIGEWKRQVQWASLEYERALRQSFSTAEKRVADLRTGLEVILIVVCVMSMLFLWLGERALRPLEELTRLARDITRRGLRKEDKSLLPEIPLSRSDEVSQLAREFHHMATALLEREKTVETQKNRLQEQNRLLRDMGELNQNILNSIDSILIVTDLNGQITQCNPGAVQWLGGTEAQLMGSDLLSWPKLEGLFTQTFSTETPWLEHLKKTPETWKLGPLMIEKCVFGGHLMPLRQEQGQPHGAIIALDDLTEDMDLQERLRRAENLAAVGRMSAQVAHEVRNPLHSIGLEAEMAVELASRLGSSSLKQSLHSILNSVDRLQKITENYLKLSRLSAGHKAVIDLGAVLRSVLVTYAPVCEVQGVRVRVLTDASSPLKTWADSDLLEQVLGNLFKNALQALENGVGGGEIQPEIILELGSTGTGYLWITIQDNGPGISIEIRNKLFTPFMTTKAQGTGLGLSFVKKVLEDHAGSIRLVEQRVPSVPGASVGACFEISLPLVEQEDIDRIEERLAHVEDFARR